MKKFIAIAVAAVFMVALAPPVVATADTAPPAKECTDPSAMQDACAEDHTVIIDQWEDEDGDIITVTEKCELDGAGNSVEIDIDDEGISVDLVLTCEYGDCGEVRHVTNLITV